MSPGLCPWGNVLEKCPQGNVLGVTSFMLHRYLKFSDWNDIYEFCISVDFLKEAESLYNELDLTGRGV